MTVLGEPATAWPEGVLFWPARQIPWQTKYIARMAAMKAAMLAADMGTGKTVMSLGVAGILLEFGLIDGVLVVCERNKLTEWLADFGTFTRIAAAVYHGPKRKRLLEDWPTAAITTYETCRDDVAVFPPKKSRKRTLLPGVLMEVIAGRRLLVIYDEITKLGRRTSNLYKAHYWMLGQLRKTQPGATYALGLTATPMDTDLDNIFNEMRLIVPHAMPTVAAYEDRVVSSRHPVYGTPHYRPEGREWFRSLCEPWMLRKRKSDPDVREYFPEITERFIRIQMHHDQFSLYRALEDLAWDEDGSHRDVPGLNVLLRQLAGDPWAVLEAGRVGDSELARMVVEECPELQKCSSAKAEELISLADLVMSSGGKLLVFTFFGQTVLPALARRLGDRPVFTYHGGQTVGQQEQQKQAFKAYPGGAILLASDAGARGINMPEISYAIEYEVARTHGLRMQRAGRGHRLGKVDPLTFITLVLDSSIEGSRAIRSLMSRNLDADFMLGDENAEGYMTAEDRRALYAQARPRKAGAPK